MLRSFWWPFRGARRSARFDPAPLPKTLGVAIRLQNGVRSRAKVVFIPLVGQRRQVAKLASLVACGPSFSWRPALMIDDPSIQRQNLPASSTFRVRQSPTKRPVRWWTSPPQGGRSTTTRLPATSSLAVNLHSFITFIAVHLVFTWLVKSLLCAATSGEHPMMAPTFCRFL